MRRMKQARINKAVVFECVLVRAQLPVLSLLLLARHLTSMTLFHFYFPDLEACF